MRVTQLVIFSGAALWLAGAAGLANPQTDYSAPDPITPASGALDGLIAPDRRAEAESLLQLYLGKLGESPSERVPEAILRRAGQGEAKAQFVLGLCYNAGRGVETNLTEAVRWYRKAAEQDHWEAQWSLAKVAGELVKKYSGEGGGLKVEAGRARATEPELFREAA